MIRQPICCVQCRLSGVNNGSLANVTTLSACHQLLSKRRNSPLVTLDFRLFEDHHDYQMRVFANDLISLNHNDENINDQIINLLHQVCFDLF